MSIPGAAFAPRFTGGVAGFRARAVLVGGIARAALTCAVAGLSARFALSIGAIAGRARRVHAGILRAFRRGVLARCGDLFVGQGLLVIDARPHEFRNDEGDGLHHGIDGRLRPQRFDRRAEVRVPGHVGRQIVRGDAARGHGLERDRDAQPVIRNADGVVHRTDRRDLSDLVEIFVPERQAIALMANRQRVVP